MPDSSQNKRGVEEALYGLSPADLDELVRVALDERYSNEFVGIILRAKLAAAMPDQGGA